MDQTGDWILGGNYTTIKTIADAWSYLLAFWGLAIFVDYFLKLAPGKKRNQVLLILLGFIILILLNVSGPILDYVGVDTSEVPISGSVILSIFVGYAMWRYDLFEIDPIKAADNIIDTMSDTLILTSRDFKIEFINEAASKALRYSKEDLLGKSILEIDSKEHDLKEYIDSHDFSKQDVVKDEEVKLKTKVGYEFPASTSISVMKDYEKKIIGYVFIFRDISTRKENEQIIEQRAQELEKMNKAMVGRELKLVELKSELDKLKKKSK
jgi:PAS domain S-box-containing protein